MTTEIARFVLDSSVTLSWAFTDEQDPSAMRAAQLLESDAADALVPVLWWYEIRNTLIVGERRSRISHEHTAIFLSQISHLPIEIAGAPDDGILLNLARETKLTVYEAAYLAVARRENRPLATLDTALRAAALSRGIPLLV